MSVKIKINWGVNMTSGTETFDLEELGCETLEEWNDLSTDDKDTRLLDALDSMPSPVYPMVDDWEVKQD